MAKIDAAGMAQLASRLGLLNPQQVQQCREEIGPLASEPEDFLRAAERKGFLTPWQSSKLIKGDLDGYFLGGYRILYKIASGSFGRVYRADDPRTGEVVAIKVLRRKWSDEQRKIDLFEREGKVGMSLQHPNIVRILAVNCDSSTRQYFIVMEFVEGGNLREILAIRKKLEPAEALAILEDAASGLAYAYSRGVTHRDMKLTNILLSSQGAAKLVDFGLAGLFAGLRNKGDDEPIDRTVDYAGLERATGVETNDVRSDIYFLGCAFYEMLTGHPPLLVTKDKNQRMMKDRFMNVRPIAPGEVNAPVNVFHLLETMIAFNPKDRYQTPMQLVEAIKVVRAGLGDARSSVSGRPTQRSVFLVEADERLRETLRDKLKAKNFRVFVASDPAFVRDRIRQRPVDALIVDARTVGEDGFFLFQNIMVEAERQAMQCAGILILSTEQAEWADKVAKNPRVAVMVHPVTLGDLYKQLKALLT